MKLYKRNAQGKPIFWEIKNIGGAIEVCYGLVGKEGRVETYSPGRVKGIQASIDSAIKAKRKEGYKQIQDVYDNSPGIIIDPENLLHYLDTYLPKDNTHADGSFIPMLCKTLENNKPFEKHHYSGQWKINGERCIITAYQDKDLFNQIHLNYRSREGVDWTDKLSYLDSYLIHKIPNCIMEMMLEEGIGLDGELYLPGYTINDINSFIKNPSLPQHYKLQYWLYDICIPDMSAIARYLTLECGFAKYRPITMNFDIHRNNEERLILLPSYDINNFDEAVRYRDKFIDMGFEGLVIRDDAASYQFGGKRNNSMLKFKRIEDGLFFIIDIVPEGKKRSDLPKFILRNDINEELFEVTINKPQDVQKAIFANKDKYIGKKMLVEYRERSGVKGVPFHAKGIRIE